MTTRKERLDQIVSDLRDLASEVQDQIDNPSFLEGQADAYEYAAEQLQERADAYEYAAEQLQERAEALIARSKEA